MASNLEPKINRIATAVTSALSALTAKGVTVPEGANVESLAALIESIDAGGDSKYRIEIGEITFDEKIIPNDENPFVIQHSLGNLPILFFATNGRPGYYPKNQICYLFCAITEWSALRSTYNGFTYATGAGSDSMNGSYASNKIVLSQTDITLGGTNSSSFLSDGTRSSTLKWIAVAQK